MDVSAQDPPLLALDLSKSYKPLTRGHAEAMDLAKKPEWYHCRPPPSCGTDIASAYRSSPTFTALSTQPGAPVHRRDLDQGPEALGNFMNSTLAPGLDLYRDGVHGNLWHPGFYGPDQSGGGGPVPESSGGEESDSGSDVIFLVSSAKEPLLCGPFLQDGVRHIVEPLSPAVSSPDDGRGCCHLPQPLSSPSPESSYSDDSSDSSVDIPVHHARPVVLLSDLGAVYGNAAESPVDISSDDSDVIEVSVSNEKKSSRTPPGRKSLLRETPPQVPAKEIRRSSRIRKSLSDTPQFTGSVSRHSLRRQVKNDAVGMYNESCDSDDVMAFVVRSSSPDAEEPVSRPDASQRARSNSDESDVEVGTESEPPPRTKRKTPLAVHKTKQLRRTKPNQKQQNQRAASSRNKKPVVRRKRKRRTHTGPSALFSPREPEIKLKYAKLKEQKKEKKSTDGFFPFVHVERRMCTVVNDREEEAGVRSGRGGRGRHAATSLSGFVPRTSCFRPGRLASESRCQATLSCRLCGQTANATGLGDLHGPYYPAADGHRSRTEHGLAKSQKSIYSSDGGRDGRDGRDRSPAVGASLPKPPLHVDECWVHEDCGIWSAGVFLVRGKLYGLEEAARLAQETVCSTCRQPGAIMGCFQKSCSRNYHYRCAIQSGCVLNEENFSMRCTEHKLMCVCVRQNKLFTSVTRQHKR
ncbi:transcription factor 20-like isoform X1 [Scophthalmus maximus]|uniref:transcription factor 20-like isoform X1 n=1 Tax=Scophthalmus maximus TaxID=52904 RepID=UPI001FA9048B|nr:transcription factor 20-like isoform X1 [Scophthalmus maximus]XP_035471700.2 transcription factor 20-like isoform X1 [Scophthalmus maximus]